MSSAIEGIAATTKMLYSRQAYADAPAPVARTVPAPEAPDAPAVSAPEARTDVFQTQDTARIEAAKQLREREEDSGTDINAIVDTANSGLEMKNHSLRFRINPDTEAIQIQVVDTERDKVIRSIPADDMIALASRLRDLSGVGAMVDHSR